MYLTQGRSCLCQSIKSKFFSNQRATVILSPFRDDWYSTPSLLSDTSHWHILFISSQRIWTICYINNDKNTRRRSPLKVKRRRQRRFPAYIVTSAHVVSQSFAEAWTQQIARGQMHCSHDAKPTDQRGPAGQERLRTRRDHGRLPCASPRPLATISATLSSRLFLLLLLFSIVSVFTYV